MKITFTLNGEQVVFEGSADVSLLSVLRHRLVGSGSKSKYLSAKRGCDCGKCGSCTVQVNGLSVPSCMIPVALVDGKRIMTLEYFSKHRMYQSIVEGFKKADIELCGFCDAGKVFAAKDYIDGRAGSTREELLNYIDHLPSCCTDRDSLATGILCAAEIWKQKSAELRKQG